MKECISREAALAALKEYNKEPFHILHGLTVEGVMRWYANELGYGEDADFWATVGLLHDIDFEMWPEQHCLKAPELLRGQLAMPQSRYENMPRPVTFMLSRGLMNFISRPQFIAYRIGRRPFPVRLSMALGAMNIGWTSHEPKNEKGRDGVIFEFYKPQLSYK